MPARRLFALIVTLALAGAGGALAAAAHLPLGWLLGALVSVGLCAGTGLEPLGLPPTLPPGLRMAFVPVIGVSVGAAFAPAMVAQVPGWLPTLGALFLFIPAAHATGYLIYRRGGLPRAEAFFGAVPGGLIESVHLGEEAGADLRVLTVLQFLRLILTILTIPLIFLALTGHSVGSAAGASLAPKAAPGLADALWLAVAAIGGYFGGRALRLPAWQMTGALGLSVLMHGAGVVAAAPPGWMVAGAQVVLGAGLGVRFAGIEPAVLWRAGRLAALNAAAAMALALPFAAALHALVGQDIAAVFLAFAPGGLAEMSLIALSLNLSAIYVTAHHVLRIVLAVSFARAGARWLRG